MEQRPPRRLRSATVQLGALTALALALSGCNMTGDDDDDCALGPQGGGDTVALAPREPASGPVGSVPTVGRGAATSTDDRGTAVSTDDLDTQPYGTGVVPEQGGFGTHLASCGG